ncbi:DUF1648 domain-containing protein [Nonomuraea basaltis]|uniref:DUF1648 domain-containing protein n=1 Tax=Nonomuraea basaltis TaxID=2495887 RepID=UPI00110C4CF9|nr:DUF1648 domain-containing protein [Nonomuraea basaltis]TMR89799.1 DUF1648 domain-containing protein [Nonomuraea basaltis]
MNPRITAAVWGLAGIAVQVLLPLAARDRLPGPLATHWGPDGRPDGTMAFGPYLAMEVLVWAVPWLVCLAVRGRAPARRQGRMIWWGALFGLGVFALGMNVTTLLANLDAPGWTETRLPGWQALIVVGAALAVTLLAGHLGRGAPDELPPAGREPARLRLRPGQRTVWVGHVANPYLALIPLIAVAAMAGAGALYLVGVLAGGTVVRILPGLVIVLLAGVLTSSVSVRAGDDWVVIGFGPLGWPMRTIALSKIQSAWSETRHPSQVGGWGIRGLPGGATIMLRGGDCLVLGYRSGGRLAISIDDAARGASLINALIPERAEP